MIRQYLSQTNKNITVAKFKMFSHLSKAQGNRLCLRETFDVSMKATLELHLVRTCKSGRSIIFLSFKLTSSIYDFLSQQIISSCSQICSTPPAQARGRRPAAPRTYGCQVRCHCHIGGVGIRKCGHVESSFLCTYRALFIHTVKYASKYMK